jgi:hypothetical protein
VFYYPLHFLSFETYAFYGFVTNEFGGTTGWGCPCSAMAGGCPPALGGSECALTGTDVLEYWDVPKWNKWCAACARCVHASNRRLTLLLPAWQVRGDRGAGSVRHLLPSVLLRRLQVQRKQVALMLLPAATEVGGAGNVPPKRHGVSGRGVMWRQHDVSMMEQQAAAGRRPAHRSSANV